MFDNQINSGAAVAVNRATEAMVRALGGQQVSVLFPMPVAPDDPAAQLGSVAPGVRELAIAPVGVRSLSAERRDGRVRLEFLFPASLISQGAEEVEEISDRTFFDAALGISHDGRLLRVEDVKSESIGGVAYLYRVTAAE